MKICPKCGKVLSYNSYFAAYICNNCSWEDASMAQQRSIGRTISPTQKSVRTTKKKLLLTR